MKLLASIAILTALSATSAFALPHAAKTYTAAYGNSSLDSATRITVTDNSGDPINVRVAGTGYNWDVSPDGPDYVLTIRSDEGGYTNLVITDNITGNDIRVPAFDHDDVNVHPGLTVGVGLKK